MNTSIKHYTKKFALSTLAFMTLVFASTPLSYSQCKAIGKKCVPNLSPYIYTGQLNSTSLFEGESAELVMAFTGGQQYRVLACASENLGKVRFVILNSKKQVVFNNKDLNFIQFWDLKVEATDDYTVQISVPPSKTPKTSGVAAQSGCVAVLVGFKNEF